jgi:hypothetical protein
MPERIPSESEEAEEERARREAEELESFERRAEWWKLHYGVPPERADELQREAVEHAERMPSSEPAAPSTDEDGA